MTDPPGCGTRTSRTPTDRIPPTLIKLATYPGQTAVTAYDGTHGYPDQYIVEHDEFLAVATEAGLSPVPGTGTVFPSERLPVISVNLLKSAQ